MIRATIVSAALIVGITAVGAQTNVIAQRKEIMKHNGAATQTGTKMVKGELPFDLAKAKEIFTTYESAAKRMPGLFPDNSKTGGETTAAPKIWQTKADFDEKFAKFARDAADAEKKVTDLSTFRTAFGEVTKNCGGCHETYRIKKQ